jgi:hypothetical protein
MHARQRGVHKLLFLLASCAACSPTGGEPDDRAAAPTPRAYRTQTTAPSPDYRALLRQAAPIDQATRQRDATARLPADAKRIGETWLARLKERDALLGFGLAGKGPDGPVEMIDTGLTRDDFDRWTSENGWRVPGHIRWSFVPALRLPAVGNAAKPAIRIWPASTARTGAQNQALYRGRVELRDGCFFAGEYGKPVDKLAWFHAEMGLDIDAAGFAVLRDRVSGATLARLGEEMNWGGPATAIIPEAAKRALHSACGPGEIYVVGSPQSGERFLAQYPHLRERGDPPVPPDAGAR